MLVGLISDSHDHVPHLERAIKVFNESGVDLVLHAGDFCSPFTVPPFEGLSMKGVFGNNDGDHYLLMKKFRDIGAEHLGTFGDIEVGSRRIALYHGTDAPITDALEKCGNYDVVVSGHTHEKRAEMIEETLAINPGTAHGFGDIATVALLETKSLDVKFKEIS